MVSYLGLGVVERSSCGHPRRLLGGRSDLAHVSPNCIWMDEDQIFQIVEKEIGLCQHEIHENRVYSVHNVDNGVDKMKLKSRFIQGDRSMPHTEVRIVMGREPRVVLENSPMYIYGEYIKMRRDMTQTPLKISGRLKCERSVSDFCSQVKSFFSAGSVTFIPAGREDFDVRMVGGRPFLLEIRGPRRNLCASHVRLQLYEGLRIVNVKVVRKGCKGAVFSGEGEARKTYRVFLCCRKRLQLQSHYVVEQKTPLRVLHRRSNLTRPKDIRIIECQEEERESWMYYEMILEASAGTYIKEFVHGDFGRTRPSLGGVGNYCDLLELDVVSVEKREIDGFVVGDMDVEIVTEDGGCGSE